MGFTKLASYNTKSIRNEDLIRAVKFSIAYIAIPVVVLSLFNDWYFYGIKQFHVIWRVGFIPVGIIAIKIYDLKAVEKRALIPLFICSAYILGMQSFFLTKSGYSQSVYIHGFIQLLIGISLLPLDLIAFVILAGTINLVYCVVIQFSDGSSNSLNSNSHAIILLTYDAVAILGYILTSDLRKNLYLLNLKQKEGILDRDIVIKETAEKLAKTKLASEVIRLENEHLDKLAKLSAQVAHDIRSPLGALKVITHQSNEFQPEIKNILDGAIERIRTIANELLKQHSHGRNIQEQSSDKPFNIKQVVQLIEATVIEKNFEFPNKIEFIKNIPTGARFANLVAPVDSTSFYRIICNLIQNSIEACEGSTSKILITVHANDKILELIVMDSGKGIPDSLIAKISDYGISHGKPSGSGLGLYFVKTKTEECKGHFEISSKEGEGTQVKVTFPMLVDNYD